MKYTYEDYASALARQDLKACKKIGTELIKTIVMSYSQNYELNAQLIPLISTLQSIESIDQVTYKILENIKAIIHSYSQC